VFPSRYGHRKNSNIFTTQPGSKADTQEEKGMYGQAARPISTGQLHALPRFHLPPIKLVIYQRPSGAYARDTLSWSWLPA
jgi:hypothetical protein